MSAEKGTISKGNYILKQPSIFRDALPKFLPWNLKMTNWA